MTANSFGSRAALQVAGQEYEIYRLDGLSGADTLPFSLKILLENLLRNEDGVNITAGQVLQDDPGRGELDLGVRLIVWVPAGERLDVSGGDVDAVLVAEQVFQQDLQAEREGV